MRQTQKTIVAIVVIVIVISGGLYFWQQKKNAGSKLPDASKPEQNQNAGQDTTSDQPVTTPKINQPVGQIYQNTKFSYSCPKDWTLNSNKNYNGQVDLSECTKIYSGEISFDDGISLTFGFVPQNMSENYRINGQKYADMIFNEVKNEANAKTYANNNFSGWISMKNERHALAMIARYEVADGYYEVSANAMGNSKTDAEFRKMTDDIVGTFQVMK